MIKIKKFFKNFCSALIEDKNRLTYTVLVLLNHFAFGISINILGVCLTDLANIYGVSIDDASFLPASLGVGYFFGALVGFLYRYFSRQLILSVLVILLAIIAGLLPWFGKLWIVIVFMFFMGIGSGGWDGSQTSWMVELWPLHPTVALQTIQLLYGVGGIVAPLLAAPFVYGDKNVTSNNETLTVDDRIHMLAIPFGITGILQVSVPICFLFLYFVYPYQKPRSMERVEENTDRVENIPNRIAKLTLGALCIGTYTGMEMNWLGFSPSLFQKLEIHMEAPDTAFMSAVMLTTYTVGRCLTAVLGNWVLPDYIALAHFTMIFISLATLYFEQNSRTLIYIFSGILGYGFSAMNAAIFAFSERHLKLTDRVCSIYAFTAGIFALIVPAILSQTFKANPEILFVIIGSLLTSAFLCFVLCGIWIIIDNRRLNRSY